MPTEVLLPDCMLQCYQYLLSDARFFAHHFLRRHTGSEFSAGPEAGITLTYGFGTRNPRPHEIGPVESLQATTNV